MASVARAQFSFPCKPTQELFSNAVGSKIFPSDYLQCKHTENQKPWSSLNSEKPAEAESVSQSSVIINSKVWACQCQNTLFFYLKFLKNGKFTLKPTSSNGILKTPPASRSQFLLGLSALCRVTHVMRKCIQRTEDFQMEGSQKTGCGWLQLTEIH